MVVDEDLADHIDLNFGCPVPKVTRKGGGAALPCKRRLFARIVRRGGERAAPAGVPVTVKMRMGIDDDHLTYLDAGPHRPGRRRRPAVALHARTAAQRYSGTADWDAIAQLKQRPWTIPVLGNGDIWEADDALRMVARDRLRRRRGRPRLPRPAVAVRRPGRRLRRARRARRCRRWARSRRSCAGTPRCWSSGSATSARRDRLPQARGVVSEGLPGRLGATPGHGLGLVAARTGRPAGPSWIRRCPTRREVLGRPRGRTNSPGKVYLPEGWLADRDDDTVPAGAELDDSGG